MTSSHQRSLVQQLLGLIIVLDFVRASMPLLTTIRCGSIRDMRNDS